MVQAHFPHRRPSAGGVLGDLRNDIEMQSYLVLGQSPPLRPPDQDGFDSQLDASHFPRIGRDPGHRVCAIDPSPTVWKIPSPSNDRSRVPARWLGASIPDLGVSLGTCMTVGQADLFLGDGCAYHGDETIERLTEYPECLCWERRPWLSDCPRDLRASHIGRRI